MGRSTVFLLLGFAAGVLLASMFTHYSEDFWEFQLKDLGALVVAIVLGTIISKNIGEAVGRFGKQADVVIAWSQSIILMVDEIGPMAHNIMENSNDVDPKIVNLKIKTLGTSIYYFTEVALEHKVSNELKAAVTYIRRRVDDLRDLVTGDKLYSLSEKFTPRDRDELDRLLHSLNTDAKNIVRLVLRSDR